MSDLTARIAKLMDDHTQRDIYSRAGDVISTSCYGCDWTPDSGVPHEIHAAEVVADYVREHFTDHAEELGFESEQWVQTPQNTGRPLRPGEPPTLGERLSNAGWWIETRFSKTVRDE